MLTLMEQVKHEQTQILGMLSGLNTKLDANTELQGFFDTPKDLKFPLDTIEDVEHFEAWLAEAANTGSKNNLVFNNIFHLCCRFQCNVCIKT